MYIYIAKGEHSPQIGCSETSCIIKAYSAIETPNEVNFASVVLEYKDAEGKWV